MAQTLMILAAGMGSRYGGLKQIDPVGPGGETIMDYSIYDALRSGFDKLVFVIRRDIESAFRESIGSRFEKRIQVEYAFQELTELPAGFALPPNRTKPWGTGQAILAAEKIIKEPFAAINADDFYGASSFHVLGEHLRTSSDFAMVGFVLRNTLSEFGSVARGECYTDASGFLKTVTERTRIEPEGNGAKFTDTDGSIKHLTGDELVSMNIWGFTPALFPQLRELFIQFLQAEGNAEKSEFYIPSAVNQLIQSRRARCKVLRSTDSWFGVTYREDRPRVVESVKALVAQGHYPASLWI